MCVPIVKLNKGLQQLTLPGIIRQCGVDPTDPVYLSKRYKARVKAFAYCVERLCLTLKRDLLQLLNLADSAADWVHGIHAEIAL